MPATLLALDLGGHVLACAGDITLASWAAVGVRAAFLGAGFVVMQAGWMAMVE